MSTIEKAGQNPPPSPVTAKEKALRCAHWAVEKKAYGMTVLEVGALTSITEYFVICSGRSVRQTRAIADHIRTRLKRDLREVPLGVEGEREGSWILLDCDDVVVHVFYEPTRELYGLEKLWSDAPVLRDAALEEEERRAVALVGEEDEWED